MIFLTRWTSIKLLSLLKVLVEQLSWTNYLWSATFHLYAFILECPRKKGLYFVFPVLLVFGSNLIMLDQLYGYNEYEIRDTQNKNKIPRNLK